MRIAVRLVVSGTLLIVLRLMVKKRLLVESAGPVSLHGHVNGPSGVETANGVAVPAFEVEPLNDRRTACIWEGQRP